jgi:hypothetical protein
MKPRGYIVYPATIAPIILSVITIVIASVQSWWYLAALPSIYIGSVCAQPNMNLADGCLAYVAAIVGFSVTNFLPPLGIAIFIGSVSGYYLSIIEKTVRMRPMEEPEATGPADNDPATPVDDKEG